jgi:hypothetical protein
MNLISNQIFSILFALQLYDLLQKTVHVFNFPVVFKFAFKRVLLPIETVFEER